MKKKILFIYTNYSTFVKTDFEILSSQHVVVKYQFKPVKGLLKTAFQLLRQLLFLVFNIWKFDGVFIWFADYHSFLPVLFAKSLGKKSFVVVGGYDVARMSKLGYGVFNSKMRGSCALYSMKFSTLNLAVSKYVERKAKWISKKTNTQLVYNCANIKENTNIKLDKEDLAITVGLIDSERTYYLKGIDTFIETARFLPKFKFMVIGMSKSLPKKILKNLPKNLELVERVNHNELESYYKKAKLYCQFSRSESFGVAIIESMNFGCIPIVSNVGGMPEIVKNSTFIVKRRDSETIAKTVEEFMNLENYTRITEIFTPELISEFSLLNRKIQIESIIKMKLK